MDRHGAGRRGGGSGAGKLGGIAGGWIGLDSPRARARLTKVHGCVATRAEWRRVGAGEGPKGGSEQRGRAYCGRRGAPASKGV